jgi:hypothetical protein
MAKGKLFQGLLEALRPGLASGGISAGLSLATGDSLPAALLYGAADVLGSAGAVAGVRALKPGRNVEIKDLKTGEVTKQYQGSGWETPANVVGAIGAGNLVSAALGRPSLFNGFQSTGQNAQQQQQTQQTIDPNNTDLTKMTGEELAQLSDEQILTILQQNKQREIINHANDLAGRYAPGTMFQSYGLPNSQSMRDEMFNTRVNANLGDIQQMMGSIAGV